jgi:integral membrane sensor domain MASE1
VLLIESEREEETMRIIDRFHRILVGQPVTRLELAIAGIVVLLWMGMDVHQYVAWLLEPACK